MSNESELEIKLGKVISCSREYAFLLGSGVSRSAGIPTGWEIMIDLIRQIKRMKSIEESNDQDSVEWYRTTYEEPSFSNLLSKLSNSDKDRQSILQQYIEPDQEKQIRIPKDIHLSIAKLIADGYIDVVITTNFDRLLEMALYTIKPNIQLNIIKSFDDLTGFKPLQFVTGSDNY